MARQAFRQDRTGQLSGTSSEPSKGAFRRLEDKDIGELDHFDLPKFDPLTGDDWVKDFVFQKELSDFLKAEGALAMVKISYRDGMLVHGEGYFYRPGETLAVPSFELAAEDYRRLARLTTAGTPPVIELALAARYDESNLKAENLFAEIPGSDPKAGYVMAGAHFDSWIAGDGAADNGAGSVVVMEAARILTRLGVKPKRTIRFALWSGEEQGLLGSLAYIESHLATRTTDPKLTGIERYAAWAKSYPISTKPGYSELKAYFNLDNGSGKIRGIYAEREQPRRRAAAQEVARALRLYGCRHCRHQQDRGGRPRLPSVDRPAGFSVHPGPAGLWQPRPPFEPRHGGSSAR